MPTQLVQGPGGTWSIIDTTTGSSKPAGAPTPSAVPVPTTTGVSTIGGSTAPYTSPGPLNLLGGADLILLQHEMDLALQKYMFDQEFKLNSQIATAQLAIQQAQGNSAVEAAQISAAASQAIAAANSRIQLAIAEKQITSNEFMQARDLAQRSAEFNRDIALRESQLAWQKEVDSATIEIQQAQTELLYLSEARQERLLQAELASNPSDTVLYEYYKRGLGTPTASGEPYDPFNFGIGALNESLSQAESLATGQAPTGQFTPPPPPYSDETLQQLVSSISSGGGPAYNPRLGGVGAFGAKVPSPNEFSRQQFQSLDATDLGVLGSFLKAGVETSPGDQRISINPEEYLSQVYKSWVPTLSEGAGGAGVPLTVVS
jgi:hypothetical protein